MAIAAALLCALGAAAAAASAPLGAAAPFRPPAVPLAVSSPFFSIWSFDASNLATQTVFWHGDSATLISLARIDNKTYTLMGATPFPAARQLGLPSVAALTSTYAFSAGGVALTLAFTTPSLPGNWEALSRQATYVEWGAASADGAAHDVQVLLGTSAEVVTGGFAGERVEWDRPAPGAQRLGLVGQRSSSGGFDLAAHMRASTEPHQRQDYGFVYLLDGTGGGGGGGAATSSLTAPQAAVQAAFAASGALPGAAADAPPPAPIAPSNNVLAARAYALAVPASGAPAAARAILLCDEVGAILNYDAILPGLWRKDYPAGDATVVPLSALAAAAAQGDALLAAASAFNAQQAAALTAAGGADYAAVAQLVFRQVLGANAVAWNGTAPWIYQKEISSDGDLSTLDVIFPSAPLLMHFDNASLLRAALEPPLYLMAGLNPANKFSQPCSLHSLGKWPVVDAGNGGCSMPMESTGDVLLLAAAVTQAQGGDGAWAAPYMPLLGRFAGYCAAALPFPAPQDMTDDFSHAPGNLTNLALKCILGIAAQAYQELAAGNSSGAGALAAVAHQQAAFFMQHAWSASVPQPHFRFIYNDTWADSAGLMYNALYARLLGAEGLFPGFYPQFQAHFAQYAGRTANATWCLPLSSMEHDSKWDWLMHTAALMFTNSSGSGSGGAPQPSAFSQLVIGQLYTFANTTSSRFPLTDHPECTGAAPPAAAADRARPVMGALYAPMLVAAPSPAVAQERARLAAFFAQGAAAEAAAAAAAATAAAAPAAAAAATAPSAVLSFFAASDTHLGHDVTTENGTFVTSYEKNVWAIEEMNTLAGAGCRGACQWPAALGGGAVATPRGVTISGDLIDAGGSPETEENGCAQWTNFTALYGLNGTDGVLKYRTYEGRGNHDGGNTTNPLPRGCITVPSRAVAARNALRAADPAFGIDQVSSPTGLHYSWTWPIDATCKVHIVHLNLLPGHDCGSPGNPGKEGTFPCTDGWQWPEDSLGFLESDLAAHASAPGTVVMVIQHYGLDGWSQTWYNKDQSAELFATLNKYKTLAVLVGHTHGASVYSFNGTHGGSWGESGAGYIDVINAPATQKEDGKHNTLPSEFMVLEAAVGAGGQGSFRVAQRVGSGWGTVQGIKNFSC